MIIYFNGVRQNNLEISGIEKFTFGQEKTTDELTTAVSGELVLTGEAYKYIKAFFIDDVTAPLKKLPVDLVDECCGDKVYKTIVLFSGVAWCSNGCDVTITLKEYTPAITCFKSTTIADDTLGFQSKAGFIGYPQYIYPQIDYCTEAVGFMIILAIIFNAFSLTFKLVLAVITFVFNIIDWFIGLFGGTRPDVPTPLDVFDDLTAEMTKTIIGCYRYVPSPLVRQYVDNVCKICGLTFESDIYNNPASEYYNTAYFFPQAHKGLLQDIDNGDWIKANEPIETGETFMNKLKPVHNAEWFIDKNNVLHFDRKDKLRNNVIAFDFQGADKGKLLGGVCYSWNGNVLPAYTQLEYAKDGIDTYGNEAARRFNDIVEFNKPFDPLKYFSGVRKVTLEFGAARFRDDGIDKDVFTRFDADLWVGEPIKNARGSLVMHQSMTSMPKLLIVEDPSRPVHARVKKYIQPAGYATFYPTDVPTINGLNNLYNYPLFFDADVEPAKSNLWTFHKIDASNNLLYNVWNLKYTLTFNYTCSDPDKCDVFSSIILPDGKQGTIDKWTVNFYNKTISLEGQL